MSHSYDQERINELEWRVEELLEENGRLKEELLEAISQHATEVMELNREIGYLNALIAEERGERSYETHQQTQLAHD